MTIQSVIIRQRRIKSVESRFSALAGILAGRKPKRKIKLDKVRGILIVGRFNQW